MVGESGVRGSSEADDGGELEGVQGVGIGKVMAIWNTQIFSFFCLRLIDKRDRKRESEGIQETREKRRETTCGTERRASEEEIVGGRRRDRMGYAITQRRPLRLVEGRRRI